jgi:hypothetical protein
MSERSISTKKPRDARQFDPALFFETAAKGRTISKHRKGEIIFSQGDDAMQFSISKRARSKSPSYPSRARKL